MASASAVEHRPLARSSIAPLEPRVVSEGWEMSGRRCDAALRLSDCTPLAKLLVRGDAAGQLRELLGAGFGSARLLDGELLAVGWGPGEWTLLGPPGALARLTTLVPVDVSGEFVSAVDVTYGHALMRLAGADAAALLAKICAIDLGDRVTPNGAAFRSSVAKLVTDVVRHDRDGEPSYLLQCDRAFGQYLFDALLDAGREFGIRSTACARLGSEACRVNLLAALQHGDSFFPGGGVAFSHGLETLHAEERIRREEDVERFLLEQLRGRWAECDRAVLLAAHSACDDLQAVAAADRALEAATLPQELRAGSRRAGAALLSVHRQLGTRNAATYDELVSREVAPGHLAVCQGAGLARRGSDRRGGRSGCRSRALRGGLGCRRSPGGRGGGAGASLLLAVRPAIAEVLAHDPPALDALASYAPVVEVAVLRHESWTVGSSPTNS